MSTDVDTPSRGERLARWALILATSSYCGGLFVFFGNFAASSLVGAKHLDTYLLDSDIFLWAALATAALNLATFLTATASLTTATSDSKYRKPAFTAFFLSLLGGLGSYILFGTAVGIALATP